MKTEWTDDGTVKIDGTEFHIAAELGAGKDEQVTETAVVWKGERLETIRDIGRALVALESPEDAREFMSAYSKHSVHAYQNVGYISGYYDRKTMIRIQEWCETSHPIFGRRVPSNDEALEAGIRMGSKLRQTGCII